MAETSAIAREALTEMRRLLGVPPGADADPDACPSQAWTAGGLVAAVQGAGLTVDVRVEGNQRPLPQAVELSAYRIRRRRSATRCGTRLGRPPRSRSATSPSACGRVRNDRPPVPGTHPMPGAAGHGIVGMRGGSPCSAAPCRPGRPATAATWSRRSCPSRRRPRKDHPLRGRRGSDEWMLARRPGDGAPGFGALLNAQQAWRWWARSPTARTRCGPAASCGPTWS